MKEACIIRPHEAGLFSLLNNVLTCAQEYQNIHVDWRGTIYGKPDLWQFLFEPCKPPKPDADVVTSYVDQWLTFKRVAELYQSPDQSWRERLNRSWSSLGLRKEIYRRIYHMTTDGSMARPCLRVGVLVRAETHAGEQVSEKSQSYDDYWRALQPYFETGACVVYLATQDNETLNHFKDRASIVYHPTAKRSNSRAVDRHLHEKQDFQDALCVMEEMLMLSQCDALIHPVSNIATAALVVNPSMQSVYLP